MIRKQSPDTHRFLFGSLACQPPFRLNSPLRGSDSGSLGRQHRKPHDGSLATVRVICFRIHHGCIILRTMFYNAVLFAHCQKLLACPGSLKRKAFSNHRYLLKNFPFPQRNRLGRRCGGYFFFQHKRRCEVQNCAGQQKRQRHSDGTNRTGNDACHVTCLFTSGTL